MAEEPNSGAPSEKLRTVRDHIRFETGERIYYDRATVLRQCGVFREPTSPSGRLLLFLNHPVNIISALLRRRA
ncbi:MAG: hypothetical protein ACHQM4_07515 [Thermoanaerobaculia bacterium]